MKSRYVSVVLIVVLSLAANRLWCDAPLSAQEILAKVDQTLNASEDQQATAKMILTDRNGRQKERVIEIIQKGTDKRLSRFLSPADQRGISVLSLPDSVIYLYLPAFKKVKRIASHIKNQSFAGTDFSYEDLEAKEYSKNYTAKLLRDQADTYVLELTPTDRFSEYSKQIMWVQKESFVVIRGELYDKKGKLYKELVQEDIQKIDGYWVPRQTEMKDLLKSHSTRMVLEEVTFDSGLSDSLFTTRYLQR
jgi:outer membrane lipoprotein-sorting protein